MNKLLAGVLAATMAFSNISVKPTDDAEMMAQMLWGECRGIESKMERAAVVWTVLNRVDDPRFPDTIKRVISQPNQFTGYLRSNPVDPDLLDLAYDVMDRWEREKAGDEYVGRVLPREYVFFVGRNGRNFFGYEWPISETWDWSAEDPYKEENNEYFDGLGRMDECDEPDASSPDTDRSVRSGHDRADAALVG